MSAKKRKRMSLAKKRAMTGYLFVLPWIVGFLAFFLQNFIKTIQYSLSEVTIDPVAGYHVVYRGIQNFKNALTVHASFNRMLAESMGDILIDIPLIIFFSLFVAILINKKFPGRTLVRAILFLPVIMATSAVTKALQSSVTQMLGGISSAAVLTETTGATGFQVDYLMDFLTEFGMPEKIVDYIVDAIGRIFDIVRASGVQILIFLAALQSVSGSLYEVAKIEGATAYETFWKITFPMVSPLIVTNVVYTIVDLYSQSEIITMASQTAFTEMNFGLSSAMSLLSSASVSIILVVVSGIISRKVFYNN